MTNLSQLTDAFGTLATATQAALAAVSARPAGPFDVRTYGAVGNNSTDDQPAIQAAIDAAGAAGGGKVYYPKGRYLLTALAVAGQAHLWNHYSNVSFEFAPGAVLVAADAYAILYQGGTTKFVDQTVYTMTAVAKNAASVTLATAGDAAHFAAGDYIYIRTGQTVMSGVAQPDAEINQVVSANAGTGVIALAWPTCKAYAREYFVSGTAGFTSTSATAHPSLFGVSNITSLIVTDQNYRDIQMEHSGTGSAYGFIGGQVLRCRIDNPSWKGNTGFLCVGAWRDYTVWGGHLDHPGAAGTYIYTLTADSGCVDGLWIGGTITGAHCVQLHMHEGAARITAAFMKISYPDAAGDVSAIDIRSRAYDIQVIGNTISGAAGGGVITVDPSCTGGGIIANNRVMAASGLGIQVTATGWEVSGNTITGGATFYAQGKTGIGSDVRSLSAWVDKDNLTVPLGDLPANVFMSKIAIQVTTAFNSNGADNISVGFASDHAGEATATDVSTTGLKAVTLAGYSGYSPTERALNAYYVAGGSAPTTGKALVTLEYTLVPQWP